MSSDLVKAFEKKQAMTEKWLDAVVSFPFPPEAITVKWNNQLKVYQKHVDKRIFPLWKTLETKQPHKKGFSSAFKTGELSGITVVDFDCMEIYNKLLADFPVLQTAPRVQTNKGMHVYFKYDALHKDIPGPNKDDLQKLFDLETNKHGVDIQSDNKIVYAPPTKYNHPEKGVVEYKWLQSDPSSVELPELPIELIERLTKKPESKPATSSNTDLSLDGFHKDILNNIRLDQYDEYPLWCKFIWAIKFTFEHEQALAVAIEYSKRSDKFVSEADVESKMNQAKDSRIGWGYLMNLSKQSDRSRHYRIIARHSNIWSDDDYNIANTALNLVDDNVCKLTNGQIYIYQNPYWVCDNGNGKLRAYICKLLREYYTHLQKEVNYDMKLHTDDEDEYKSLTEKLKVLLKAVSKVNNSYHSKCILDFFCINMVESEIEFDTYQPYYFCFTNCAFDLKTNKPVEVKRDDYITQHTGYAYYKSSKDELAEISKLVDSVFFDSEEKKKSYISVLRTGMIGKYFEKFVLANGVGRNGKGAVNEMQEIMLGGNRGEKGYFYKATPTSLTQDMKAGANPELANMHKMRFVVAQEPKEGALLNLGTIKALTGGENINARKLYSNDTNVKLMNTLVLECNKKPKFDGRVDEAIIQRFINEMFKAVFTDDASKIAKLKGYFAKDAKYKNAEWQRSHRCAFFDYLLQYDYIDIYEPKEVRDATFDYLCESDDFTAWLDQHFEVTDNKKDIMKLKEMCSLYKDTYLKMGSREYRKMTAAKFLEKLQENIKWKHIVDEHYHAKKTNYFTCVKIATNEDSDSDSDYQ